MALFLTAIFMIIVFDDYKANHIVKKQRADIQAAAQLLAMQDVAIGACVELLETGANCPTPSQDQCMSGDEEWPKDEFWAKQGE